MLTGLNFVMIHVQDMTAARAFYTEQLGLTVADENPAFIQFAQPGGQGATFAIGVAENATPLNEGTELWWFTDDADAEYAALVARGVTVVEEPHDMPFGRTFAIKDTADNTISFLTPGA